MSPALPPPLPVKRRLNWVAKLAIFMTIALGVVMVLLVSLRALGLGRPYRVPASSMAPAITKGDHVYAEGISYLFRRPRRGEIVVFKTDRIGGLVPPGQIWVKRIAALPGEQVRIADGRLHINGSPVPLRNEEGDIVYDSTSNADRMHFLDVVVPPDHFYMLGDNSSNSLDSRWWGFVPAENIKGRIFFRYLPPPRAGSVK